MASLSLSASLLSLLAAAVLNSSGHAQVTTRISVDSDGVQGNDMSEKAAFSADGRYVAFESYATNLVPGDTNGAMDVFIHDRVTSQTSRVSVDSAGLEGNWTSEQPSISSDGRYVAFWSYASNLVPGDTNMRSDVFVHDRMTGQTSRVSVGPGGLEANEESSYASISADGRMVAFDSGASNLVPGDTNAMKDVFVHDRLTGLTSRVSEDSEGVQGNRTGIFSSISADGRYVGWVSNATNLVRRDTNRTSDSFVHDRFGFRLTLSGSCPGPVTATVENATRHGAVGLLFGRAGDFTNPGLPCPGIRLDLKAPRPGLLLFADASGIASMTANAPAGACGLTFQAVDLATCEPSNSVVL